MIDESIIHPYEVIPLQTAGLVLGLGLVVVHLVAWLWRDRVQVAVRGSVYNEGLGVVAMGLAMLWFYLLVGPEGMGVVSALRVNLTDFEGIRWLLQLACPAFLILMVLYVKQFLFARALGVLGLLVVAPFLAAAYLKDPMTRLLIPVWAYFVIAVSCVLVLRPYLYRDAVAWMTAQQTRWTVACVLGVGYGVILTLCAIVWY